MRHWCLFLLLCGLLLPGFAGAESLRVVVAQIENSADPERQVALVGDFLKREDLRAGDLVLFPELALTGYTPGFLSLSPERIEGQLGQVRALAREKRVYAFLGLPRYRNGLRFNTYLLIGPAGEILREFDKAGFTATDAKLFTQGSDPERTVKVKGFTVGVVICAEAALGLPFEAQFARADLVVWPGFWAWPTAFDWLGEDPTISGIKKFQARFRKPLFQANYSLTPAMPYPEEFTGGGSVFVGAEGELRRRLRVGREDAGFFEVVIVKGQDAKVVK